MPGSRLQERRCCSSYVLRCHCSSARPVLLDVLMRRLAGTNFAPSSGRPITRSHSLALTRHGQLVCTCGGSPVAEEATFCMPSAPTTYPRPISSTSPSRSGRSHRTSGRLAIGSWKPAVKIYRVNAPPFEESRVPTDQPGGRSSTAADTSGRWSEPPLPDRAPIPVPKSASASVGRGPPGRAASGGLVARLVGPGRRSTCSAGPRPGRACQGLKPCFRYCRRAVRSSGQVRRSNSETSLLTGSERASARNSPKGRSLGHGPHGFGFDS